MKDYPASLKLEGRGVLLVGGGAVAEGRLCALLEVGAHVHVVAVRARSSFHAYARDGRIVLSLRAYGPRDGDGTALILSAVDDPVVSEAIARDARARGIWVNCADIPSLCDFHLPSVGRRGPVTVAVSTAGSAPGFSRQLRQRLMLHVTAGDAALARVLGLLRRRHAPGAERRTRLDALLSAALPEVWISQGRSAFFKRVRALLKVPPSEKSQPGD